MKMLQSGASIWPPGTKFHTSDVPTRDDIAWGLARIVRFAGQTKHWYSVLLHTLTVADIIAPEYKAYALLHDAPECVVSDVPTTNKTRAAKDREHELLELICMDYMAAGEDAPYPMRWPWPDDAADALAEADEIALAAEAHALGHHDADAYWPYKPYARRNGFYEAEELTRRRFPAALFYAANPDLATHLYAAAFDTSNDLPL